MYFAPAVDDQVWALRAAVEDVLTVETVQMGRGAVTFSGSLRHDAERSFAYLESRFSPLGYTPLLRRTQGTDEVVAVEGIVGVSRSNWVINVLLFIATVVSVLVVGLQIFSPLGALVYMLGLLLVLGCHEFGHYIVARVHGMVVTLPYFIPFPCPRWARWAPLSA